MTVVGLDHVQLAAPPGCEDEARQFFGELLGLAEIPKPEQLQSRGGVWFACGAHGLHIGVEQPFSPARKAHPALRIVRYDALLERLAAAGVDTQPDVTIPGVRRCYVADPEPKARRRRPIAEVPALPAPQRTWGNRLELVSAE